MEYPSFHDLMQKNDPMSKMLVQALAIISTLKPHTDKTPEECYELVKQQALSIEGH